LQEPLLGEFPFYSGKAERLATAHQGRCTAFFFAMHVTEVLAVWPEAGQRDREWVSESAGAVATLLGQQWATTPGGISISGCAMQRTAC
jgi:hypothetical protein